MWPYGTPTSPAALRFAACRHEPSIARFVAVSSARNRGRAYDSLFTSTDSLDAFPPSQHSPRAREFQMVLEKTRHEQVSAPTPALQAKSGTLRGATPSHQEIAHAAFCQWQTHGGDAEQNWLTCERQLRDRGSTVDEVASHTHIRRR